MLLPEPPSHPRVIARYSLLLTSLLVVSVCVASCDGGDDSRTSASTKTAAALSSPAEVRTPGGYRVVGRPYASVSSSAAHRTTTATVTVRMNRRLKLADTHDGIAAQICLDGHCGVSPALRTGTATHYCYTQATIDEIPYAKTGDRTVLTIRIPGVGRRLRMTLRYEPTRADRLRNLCGKRTIFDPIP